MPSYEVVIEGHVTVNGVVFPLDTRDDLIRLARVLKDALTATATEASSPPQSPSKVVRTFQGNVCQKCSGTLRYIKGNSCVACVKRRNLK